MVNCLWMAKLGDTLWWWQRRISNLVRMASDCMPTITGFCCKQPCDIARRERSSMETSGLGIWCLFPCVPFLIYWPVTYSQIYLRGGGNLVYGQKHGLWNLMALSWNALLVSAVWLQGRFSTFLSLKFLICIGNIIKKRIYKLFCRMSWKNRSKTHGTKSGT